MWKILYIQSHTLRDAIRNIRLYHVYINVVNIVWVARLAKRMVTTGHDGTEELSGLYASTCNLFDKHNLIYVATGQIPA